MNTDFVDKEDKVDILLDKDRENVMRRENENIYPLNPLNPQTQETSGFPDTGNVHTMSTMSTESPETDVTPAEDETDVAPAMSVVEDEVWI